MFLQISQKSSVRSEGQFHLVYGVCFFLSLFALQLLEICHSSLCIQRERDLMGESLYVTCDRKCVTASFFFFPGNSRGVSYFSRFFSMSLRRKNQVNPKKILKLSMRLDNDNPPPHELPYCMRQFEQYTKDNFLRLMCVPWCENILSISNSMGNFHSASRNHHRLPISTLCAMRNLSQCNLKIEIELLWEKILFY